MEIGKGARFPLRGLGGRVATIGLDTSEYDMSFVFNKK